MASRKGADGSDRSKGPAGHAGSGGRAGPGGQAGSAAPAKPSGQKQSRRQPVDQNLALIGDVRPAPFQVLDDAGTPYSPYIALWAVAADGMVWGFALGDESQRPALLVQALQTADPLHEDLPKGPGTLILFDEALAKAVQQELNDPRIQFEITEPFEDFDTMFDSLLRHLAQQSRPTLDLPDEVVAALCSAAERLWQTKPWQVAFDHPLIEIAPRTTRLQKWYASVLGAAREVYGVAFYSTIRAYARDAQFSTPDELDDRREALAGTGLEGLLDLFSLPDFDDEDDANDEDEADEADEGDDEEGDEAVVDEQFAEALDAMAYAISGDRVLLVSFDPKEELPQPYIEQFERSGWLKEHDVVPTLMARGQPRSRRKREAGPEPHLLPDEEEARQLAPLVEAVAIFCERHEDAIIDEAFPIEDTVDVPVRGKVAHLTMHMPPKSEQADPESLADE